MKSNMFFIMFLGAIFMASAQPRLVTKNDLKKINKEIEKEVITLKKEEESKSYLNDYSRKLSLEFKTDTLRIEKLFYKKLDIDYSTSGMVNAVGKAESDYDALLNKYYNRLMGKLEAKDKEIMKQSQLNWIKFRDSEKQVNYMIAKDGYSAGGTMQNVITADKSMQITKNRVIELFEYLLRFYK